MMKTKIKIDTSWEKIGRTQSLLQEISTYVENLPIKELNVNFRYDTDVKRYYIWIQMRFENGKMLESNFEDFNYLFSWVLYNSIRKSKVIVKGKGYLSELFEQVKNAL